MLDINNIFRLSYMLIVTIFYQASLQAIYFDKLFQMNEEGYIGIAVIEIIYIFGPIGLLFMDYISKRVYYRVLFFAASISSAIYILLYKILQENMEGHAKNILILLISFIEAPFRNIFYCTFNYYVNQLSKYNNKGVYFGIAYSMLCTSALFSALFVQLTQTDRDDDKNSMIFVISLSITICTSLMYWFITEPHQINNNSRDSLLPIEKYFKTSNNKNKQASQPMLQIDKPRSFLMFEFIKIWKNVKIMNIWYILPNIFILSLIYSFKMVISSAMVIYIAHGQFNENIDSTITSILVLVQVYFGIGQFVGGVLCGLIGDLHNRLSILFCIQFITFTTYLFAILALSIQNIRLMYGFIFLLGLSLSAQQTATFSFFASQFPEHQQILTLCVWFFSIGIAINSLIFSLTFIDTSSQSSFYYLIGYALICILINILSTYQYISKERIRKSEPGVEMMN